MTLLRARSLTTANPARWRRYRRNARGRQLTSSCAVICPSNSQGASPAGRQPGRPATMVFGVSGAKWEGQTSAAVKAGSRPPPGRSGRALEGQKPDLVPLPRLCLPAGQTARTRFCARPRRSHSRFRRASERQPAHDRAATPRFPGSRARSGARVEVCGRGSRRDSSATGSCPPRPGSVLRP
jgi:hypothetical protein